MSPGQGYSYDASGNTTADPRSMTFTYDGENKQVEVRDTTITPTTSDPDADLIGRYWYDGDGKRVKKYAPPRGGDPGETTIFVYDAGGKQIAEYSTAAATQTQAKVSYLTSDHLGSPRIDTDASGAVISRHDYHPFGEEISTPQRINHPEYAGDRVRKQFTGYERDKETELDFAQARYYAKELGRFSSVDLVKMSSQRMRNPQQLNLYSYAVNNPLKFVDPDGEDNELVTEERKYSFSIAKVDTVNGKKITTQIDFKVTEKLVDIFNDKGEFVNKGIRVQVETTNGAHAQNILSDGKLSVAAQNAATVIATSWQLGIDKSVSLATASKETLMGAADGGPRSDGAINPMQLTDKQFHPNSVKDSNGQVMQNTNKSMTDREHNIYLSIVLLQQKIAAAGSIQGGFRDYGPPKSQDPNYVSDSLNYNTQIQQSINSTQTVNQPFVVNQR